MLSDYTPMAPTQVREPFHRDGRIYEEKVDGWRMLAYKDGARVRLVGVAFVVSLLPIFCSLRDSLDLANLCIQHVGHTH